MEEDKKIFLINGSATVNQVLELITENHRGAAIVVDDDGKLLGVISDGDIRRGLVHGDTMLTPINKIMNINCVYLEESKTGEAEGIFKQHIYISLIPVVDNENNVVDILTRK
jgi:arabinose-5-phosphate isomerase